MVRFSNVLGYSFLLISMLLLNLSCSVSTTLLELSLWSPCVCSIGFGFIFDKSSVLFGSTVFLISGAVIVYCSWYMDDETYYKRFIFIVLLFVGSMILLIVIPNLICLLIGWDGLGITSFLLVVYYQNNNSLGAGLVTALVNRVGDVLLLVSISVLASEGSWLVYESEFSAYYPSLGVVLIFGAITNSAQIPFSAWLPAAIAAPTPVSSLVHSSTLVTAGVYLLYRCSGLICLSYWGIELLKVLSLLTLVIAGSAALTEVDLNNVIALSTLSQLSMMLFSLSLGLFSVTFFHLITHASFNALLFLCAGVVIHSNYNIQDIRFVGNNWAVLPFSMSCLLVGNISLCGVPFLSGFYSNDIIIELALAGNELFVAYVLLVLGTLFTSLYSLRLVLNVVYGANKGSLRVIFGGESVDLKMSYSILLISAVCVGWVLSSLDSSLCHSVHLFVFDKSMASLFVVFAAVGYGFTIIIDRQDWNKNTYWFLGSMWNLNSLTTQAPSYLLLSFSDQVVVSLENGWLEEVGPQGAGSLVKTLGQLNQRYQQYSFLPSIIVSLSALISIFVLSVLL